MNVVMKDVDPKVRNKLLDIMCYDSSKIISQDDFLAMVSPWASFSATDINNDNELDILELKTLFWLMENSEPD